MFIKALWARLAMAGLPATASMGDSPGISIAWALTKSLWLRMCLGLLSAVCFSVCLWRQHVFRNRGGGWNKETGIATNSDYSLCTCVSCFWVSPVAVTMLCLICFKELPAANLNPRRCFWKTRPVSEAGFGYGRRSWQLNSGIVASDVAWVCRQ